MFLASIGKADHASQYFHTQVSPSSSPNTGNGVPTHLQTAKLRTLSEDSTANFSGGMLFFAILAAKHLFRDRN